MQVVKNLAKVFAILFVMLPLMYLAFCIASVSRALGRMKWQDVAKAREQLVEWRCTKKRAFDVIGMWVGVYLLNVTKMIGRWSLRLLQSNGDVIAVKPVLPGTYTVTF